MILRHAVGFAMLGNQVLQVAYAAAFKGLFAVRRLGLVVQFVLQHGVQVSGKNNAGATLVSCSNLRAETARGKSAGARIQLRVELLQGRDAV